MWYRIVIRKAHLGARRTHPIPVYIFARDINEVLDRFNDMPGVKKKYGPEEVRPLTKKQANRLESVIRSDKKISFYEAKNRWYYVDPTIEPFILYYSHGQSSEF